MDVRWEFNKAQLTPLCHAAHAMSHLFSPCHLLYSLLKMGTGISCTNLMLPQYFLRYIVVLNKLKCEVPAL